MNIIEILGSLALVALAVWAACRSRLHVPLDCQPGIGEQCNSKDCQSAVCIMARAANVGRI